MPTHLYCLIAEDEAPAPGDTDVRGLGDAPVRALTLSTPGHGVRMVAWVSTVAEARIPRELAQLRTTVLQHDRVTQAALQHARGIVPALMGDPYPDDDGCRDALVARSSEIEALWTRALNTVEMTLLLAPRPAASQAPLATGATAVGGGVDAGRGRRYLETLRDKRQAIEDRVATAVDALRAAVGPVVVASARRDDRERIALSHAVSRDHVEAYRRSASEVALPDGLMLTVDGPRAPYSFAALAAPFRRHDSGDLIGD